MMTELLNLLAIGQTVMAIDQHEGDHPRFPGNGTWQDQPDGSFVTTFTWKDGNDYTITIRVELKPGENAEVHYRLDKVGNTSEPPILEDTLPLPFGSDITDSFFSPPEFFSVPDTKKATLVMAATAAIPALVSFLWPSSILALVVALLTGVVASVYLRYAFNAFRQHNPVYLAFGIALLVATLGASNLCMVLYRMLAGEANASTLIATLCFIVPFAVIAVLVSIKFRRLWEGFGIFMPFLIAVLWGLAGTEVRTIIDTGSLKGLVLIVGLVMGAVSSHFMVLDDLRFPKPMMRNPERQVNP